MALLPHELSRWQHLRFIKKRTATEYSSECPECGDMGHVGSDAPDRFRMFDDGKPRGWCRACGFFAFADTKDGKLTDFELAEIRLERLALLATERERVKQMIQVLEEKAEWRGYHKFLLENNMRQLWRDAGINDNMQEYWELGYNPSLMYTWNGESKTSPALTIPYWKGEHVINLQSRLLEPVSPNDKYRFTSGLPAPLFDPEKEDSIPSGPVLLVEGAKKAMVTWLHLGGRYRIMGMPSKFLSQFQLEDLKECEPIVMALDPDATYDGTAERNAEALGRERVRLVRLPDKIDDLFVHHGATPDMVDSFIRVARSA